VFARIQFCLSCVAGARANQNTGQQITKLYVGSLPYSISDESLLQLFTEKGYRPVSARAITDRPGPGNSVPLMKSGQISPRFILSIKKSHERTQRVMMVRVGFWQGLEVKPEASITKRFLMSWHC